MEEFQQQMKNKRSISICLYECLEHTNKNPQDIKTIGVFWIDDDYIFLHTKTFSNFISKRANTINKFLKRHGFNCEILAPSITSNVLAQKNIFENSFSGCSTVRTNYRIHKYNEIQMIDNKSRNDNQNSFDQNWPYEFDEDEDQYSEDQYQEDQYPILF